jgi:hypothetical protein
MIKVGMNLPDMKALCENYLLENGADSFWYWDVGAFVFAGDVRKIDNGPALIEKRFPIAKAFQSVHNSYFQLSCFFRAFFVEVEGWREKNIFCKPAKKKFA